MEDNELVSTDEAILSHIGEGDEQTSDESTDEESTGTSEDTTQAASTASSEQGTDGSTGTEQQPAASGPQDLKDANGNVIASGGKERRFYETAQREKARAESLQRENESLKTNAEAINNAGTLSTQYELSPEELTTGAQLISSYKNNPVETIQYMLTQAQSQGYNVDQIINGGTDMSAIKQMIDTSLAPLVGEQQQRADTQEAHDRATEIYNGFMSQYPDAGVHEDSLSRLMQQDQSLSVKAAYFKLQNYYLQKGLDWTKSLAVLQEEINSQPVAPSAPNTQPQPPNGNVNASNTTDTAQVADVRTSTSDIIRDAMAEAGIN